MSPKKFSIAIEKTVIANEVTYMEAVLDYCEKNSIEPDTIKPLISKSLKEKIESNARDLNYLPRVAQLPI